MYNRIYASPNEMCRMKSPKTLNPVRNELTRKTTIKCKELAAGERVITTSHGGEKS